MCQGLLCSGHGGLGPLLCSAGVVPEGNFILRRGGISSGWEFHHGGEVDFGVLELRDLVERGVGAEEGLDGIRGSLWLGDEDGLEDIFTFVIFGRHVGVGGW